MSSSMAYLHQLMILNFLHSCLLFLCYTFDQGLHNKEWKCGADHTEYFELYLNNAKNPPNRCYSPTCKINFRSENYSELISKIIKSLWHPLASVQAETASGFHQRSGVFSKVFTQSYRISQFFKHLSWNILETWFNLWILPLYSIICMQISMCVHIYIHVFRHIFVFGSIFLCVHILKYMYTWEIIIWWYFCSWPHHSDSSDSADYLECSNYFLWVTIKFLIL